MPFESPPFLKRKKGQPKLIDCPWLRLKQIVLPIIRLYLTVHLLFAFRILFDIG